MTDHCDTEVTLADMKLSDNQFVANMAERPSRSFWDKSDFPLNNKFSSITEPPVVRMTLGEMVILDNGQNEPADMLTSEWNSGKDIVNIRKIPPPYFTKIDESDRHCDISDDVRQLP